MLSFFTAFFAITFGILATSIGDVTSGASGAAQLVVVTTLVFGIASALAGILYSRTIR